MLPNHTTPFNRAHAVEYGVKICEVDPSTEAVVLAVCLFCIHFSQEEKVGQKRKTTSCVKYLSAHFADTATIRLILSCLPFILSRVSSIVLHSILILTFVRVLAFSELDTATSGMVFVAWFWLLALVQDSRIILGPVKGAFTDEFIKPVGRYSEFHRTSYVLYWIRESLVLV